MANTYTTNYNLAKPAHGDVDWHIPINGNFDTIDTTMKDNANRICPTGSIIMYGAATAPTGWLLCDGSAVSRTTYADLFAIIGTTFGVGNGSTTFNLPDLRDRFVVGAGTSYNNNDTGGEATHVLTIEEMPAHSHNIYIGPHAQGTRAATYYTDSYNQQISTSSVGGNQGHNNLPPYIGLTFIIKT
jgi:microcystin-dependent protein